VHEIGQEPRHRDLHRICRDDQVKRPSELGEVVGDQDRIFCGDPPGDVEPGTLAMGVLNRQRGLARAAHASQDRDRGRTIRSPGRVQLGETLGTTGEPAGWCRDRPDRAHVGWRRTHTPEHARMRDGMKCVQQRRFQLVGAGDSGRGDAAVG
jgi:hypothetical protein